MQRRQRGLPSLTALQTALPFPSESSRTRKNGKSFHLFGPRPQTTKTHISQGTAYKLRHVVDFYPPVVITFPHALLPRNVTFMVEV